MSADDSWFSAIYQLDEEDDWKDTILWSKACPSIDITVSRESIEADLINAINNPSTETQFKTKQLNMWCSSTATWITQEEIRAVTQKFELEDFDKSKYWAMIGVDLATRSDLCVTTTLIYKDEKFWFKAFPFICERAFERSKNKELYRKWYEKGYLDVIKGEYIDLDIVIEKLFEIGKKVRIGLVAYDPWQADQFISKCRNKNIPTVAVKQDFKTMNSLIGEFENLIFSKRMVIDDSPITRWCFSNVIITYAGELRKVDKSSGENKIDIVVAFLDSLKLQVDLMNNKNLMGNEVTMLTGT